MNLIALLLIGENSAVNQQIEPSADTGLDQLVRGVGQVCISACMPEWSLTYLTGLIENWDATKLREVLGHPGEPLRKYRALVAKLEAFGLGPTLARSPATPDGSWKRATG